MLALIGGGLLLSSVVTADIVLYGSSDLTVGNIGPRLAATAFCAVDMPDQCNTTQAVLSYSNDPVLSLYPTNTSDPVVGPTGTLIATNWSSLWSGGTLINNLYDASVIQYVYWYSGSNPDGSFNGQNCYNWSTSSSAVAARAGRNNVPVSPGWVSAGRLTCGQAAQLLCSCHRDGPQEYNISAEPIVFYGTTALYTGNLQPIDNTIMCDPDLPAGCANGTVLISQTGMPRRGL